MSDEELYVYDDDSETNSHEDLIEPSNASPDDDDVLDLCHHLLLALRDQADILSLPFYTSPETVLGIRELISGS